MQQKLSHAELEEVGEFLIGCGVDEEVVRGWERVAEAFEDFAYAGHLGQSGDLFCYVKCRKADTRSYVQVGDTKFSLVGDLV